MQRSKTSSSLWLGAFHKKMIRLSIKQNPWANFKHSILQIGFGQGKVAIFYYLVS